MNRRRSASWSPASTDSASIMNRTCVKTSVDEPLATANSSTALAVFFDASRPFIVDSPFSIHMTRVSAKMALVQSRGSPVSPSSAIACAFSASSASMPALSSSFAAGAPWTLDAIMPRLRAVLELRRSSFDGSIWSSLLSCASRAGSPPFFSTSNCTPMT